MTVDQLATLAPGTFLYSDTGDEPEQYAYYQQHPVRPGFHWLNDEEGDPERFSTAELLARFHLTRVQALRSIIARKQEELRELKSQLPV